MTFVIHHSVWAFNNWILLMWKSRKSEIKRVTKLKQCIVRDERIAIIPLKTHRNPPSVLPLNFLSSCETFSTETFAKLFFETFFFPNRIKICLKSVSAAVNMLHFWKLKICCKLPRSADCALLLSFYDDSNLHRSVFK